MRRVMKRRNGGEGALKRALPHSFRFHRCIALGLAQRRDKYQLEFLQILDLSHIWCVKQCSATYLEPRSCWRSLHQLLITVSCKQCQMPKHWSTNMLLLPDLVQWSCRTLTMRCNKKMINQNLSSYDIGYASWPFNKGPLYLLYTPLFWKYKILYFQICISQPVSQAAFMYSHQNLGVHYRRRRESQSWHYWHFTQTSAFPPNCWMEG